MRAKKSLGQNFLHNKRIIQDVVDAADLTHDATVLEIGPGKGALTEPLLATGAHVIAVETDRDLIPVLEERFTHELADKQLELIAEDITETDREAIGLRNNDYILVANIPYYITGLIIRDFLSNHPKPSRMVLVMQKEVAERIVERDGKGSILSQSVAAYGKARYITKIPKRFFSPVPNVDSAVLRIDLHATAFFSNTKEEEFFFTVVKTGFGSKRKKLINNLTTLGYTKEHLDPVFTKLDLDPNIRAEKLTTKQWLRLSREL